MGDIRFGLLVVCLIIMSLDLLTIINTRERIILIKIIKAQKIISRKVTFTLRNVFKDDSAYQLQIHLVLFGRCLFYYYYFSCVVFLFPYIWLSFCLYFFLTNVQLHTHIIGKQYMNKKKKTANT